MRVSTWRRRWIVAVALVSALTVGLGASSAAKREKPIAVAGSVSISPSLKMPGDPLSLWLFVGKVRAKPACRADRQVAVALSTDGGAASPDRRKGGFTEGDGDWTSVYDIVLTKGHSYTAYAVITRTIVTYQKQRFRCKAARSSTVTLTP